MTKIYKLQNQIKHYEWGSPYLIPEFLGIENVKKTPYAELWMGTHSGAPSKAEAGGAVINLKDIAGELPYLFKILAIDKPLSLQAHPNKIQAEEGFKREEISGLALNAPLRNYRDANHKPEIICAITPFTLMTGFRQPEVIKETLNDFLVCLPQLKEIITPLLRALDMKSLAVFFRNLYLFSNLGKEYFSALISGFDIEKTGGTLSVEQWNLMKILASQYPGDPAILAPLFLNFITLKPWQAINTSSGTLHGYVSGFGVELMANSDNSIRGGLTPKNVNIPELMNIVNFNPVIPVIITPNSLSNFTYPSICDDYSLSVMKSDGENRELRGKCPLICLVVEGGLKAGSMIFKKGDSFFIPDNSEPVPLNGQFTLFTAASHLS